MPGLHLIAIAWNLVVFLALVVALPALLVRAGSIPDRLARGCLYGCSFLASAVLLLGSLRCMNSLSLVLLGGLAILLHRITSSGGSPRHIASAAREALLIWFQQAPRSPRVLGRAFSAWQHRQAQRVLTRCAATLGDLPWITFVFLGVLVLAASAIAAGHLASLHSLRMGGPDAYTVLLRTRELLRSTEVFGQPRIAPALAAALAAFSGSDASASVQVLSALVPVLLAGALARLVFVLTRSLLASAVSLYCLGMAFPAAVVSPFAAHLLGDLHPFTQLLRIPPAPQLETQSLLLLLLLWMAAVVQVCRPATGADLWRPTAAAASVLVLSGTLLPLALPFFAALLLCRWPRFALTAGSTAVAAALTYLLIHDEALAPGLFIYGVLLVCFLAGMLTYSMERLLVYAAGPVARFAPAAAWGFVLALYMPPQAQPEQPLEYEAVTQNAYAIAQQFHDRRWLIAAPVEQLAEVYSLGSFQDLAEWVNASQPGNLGATLSTSGYDDVFIFVEKSPFNIYAAEPASVTFATITDSTYRSYRSPAGRASLELRAVSLCESYRQQHKDMSIFFDDGSVLVYRLHLSHAVPHA